MFSANIFSIFTIANLSNNNLQNVQTQNSGFDLVKIQTSLAKKINNKMSVELFMFKDIWGRNTGSGFGGGSAISYSF